MRGSTCQDDRVVRDGVVDTTDISQLFSQVIYVVVQVRPVTCDRRDEDVEKVSKLRIIFPQLSYNYM